jgi:hypothetical protein
MLAERVLAEEYTRIFPLNRWVETVERRESACRRVARENCGQVRFVRDTPVYDYPTVGCEIRSVTKADVERDAARWRRYETLTEADVLQHELMGDVLDGCAAAAENGFAWAYEPPVVEKGCKPRK